MPSVKVKGFSCGSEFMDFMVRNCQKCKKYNYEKPKCKIDITIGMAYCYDGMIPVKIYDLIKTGECLKFVDKNIKIKRKKRIDKLTLSLFGS